MFPSYLKNYADLYKTDPRRANREWFKNARYGLFIHYGLYSLSVEKYGICDRPQEWVQYNNKIHVDEYALLEKDFTAEDFSAKDIVTFAKKAGMRYINLTTRHHDCFCLFNTKETEFNSLNSPAKRDFVKELSDECEKEELAFFAYYSHGRDWRHPHAPNNDSYGGAARPEYETAEPHYKYGKEHDLDIYLDFMKAQITELLTQYPTIAGIWLDGIATPMSGDAEAFKVQELYDLVQELSPHAILSYKQGLLGTEDFFAPEHKIPTLDTNTTNTQEHQKNISAIGKITTAPEKTIEMCTTMITSPVSWGYKGENCTHLTAEQVEEKLRHAIETGYNLLLNVGPTPSGAIEKCDKTAILSVGEKIAKGEIVL